MNASEFQHEAKRTDTISWETKRGIDVAILGMIGELGSLASVLKKHQRDHNSYLSYAEDFAEEMGDILWYVTTIATHIGVNLVDWPVHSNSVNIYDEFYKLHELVIQLSGKRPTLETGEYNEGTAQLINSILSSLQNLAFSNTIGLAEIAKKAINKTLANWGTFSNFPARYFDKDYPKYEQLPRVFSVDFQSINQGKSIILFMNGIAIGDRLTDNSYIEDGYRFHDIFHIAGAAMLGWSPVFRRLLKAKRKSNPRKDEVDDGARAAIVEEAVLNHVFDHARSCNFFNETERVDLDLIKRIQKLVRGYEVEECEPWEWKMCILKSYEIFRKLRSNEYNGGRVLVNADKRSLTLEKLPPK